MTPADQAGARAQCQALEHALTAVDAAVEQYFASPRGRIHHAWQCGDGRRRAVELPATMIRYDDAIDAAGCRGARVVGVEDSLQNELAGPAIAQPGDIVPGERVVQLLAHPLGKRRGAVAWKKCREIPECPAPAE